MRNLTPHSVSATSDSYFEVGFRVADNSLCALKPFPKPAVRDPYGSFVVVFAETLLEVAHRIAVPHAPGSFKTLQLVHNRTFRTAQTFCDRRS